jgi:hypothetical protein
MMLFGGAKHVGRNERSALRHLMDGLQQTEWFGGLEAAQSNDCALRACGERVASSMLRTG